MYLKTQNLYTLPSKRPANLRNTHPGRADKKKKGSSGGGGSWLWFFFKLIFFVGVVAGGYFGWQNYQAKQRYSTF